jgi:CDP-paratose synthetase
VRILITGATGFLGSRLAIHLLDAGHTVVAIRRPTSCARRLGAYGDLIEWHTDEGAGLEAAARAADAVVHAACAYGRSGESPVEMATSNLIFPLRVHAAAVGAQVPLFVDCGTALPRALSPYTLAKHQFAEWAALSTGEPAYVHLSIEHFYGPGDDERKFVAWLVRRCLTGGDVPLTRCDQIRDFIHVDDVVAAIATVLSAPPRGGRYGIGTGQGITMRHFAELTAGLSGGSAVLRFGAVPYRDGEPMRCIADITGISALGWRPSISLADGLAAVVAEARHAPGPGKEGS